MCRPQILFIYMLIVTCTTVITLLLGMTDNKGIKQSHSTPIFRVIMPNVINKKKSYIRLILTAGLNPTTVNIV